MKKTSFLFLLIFTGFILSCKKSNDQTVSAESLIEGTWTTTSETFDYYNSAGNIVYSENGTTGLIFNFNKGTVKDVTNNQTDTYTFVKLIGSDNYSLTFNGTNVSDIKTLNVLFSGSSSTIMHWSAESTQSGDVQYPENGMDKSAAKVVLSVSLNKN